MVYTTASNAWNESLVSSKTNLVEEDMEMLRAFGKMLGKTDVEGQVKEIELTNLLLEKCINHLALYPDLPFAFYWVNTKEGGLL